MRQHNLRQHFWDQVIHCGDCGQSFVFTAGEQAFFLSKSLSEPKRCKPCRELWKGTLIPVLEVQHV
ncbi:MAG TPA: hypothetical protein G4O10_08580 [Dehalococcoidia bacterium]|nr:hypothetical protein [Dehalococcoidia bacterium]